MFFRTLFAAIVALHASTLRADDKPLSRTEQFKALQSEFDKASAEIVADIRSGKVKPGKDGRYAEIAELQALVTKRARPLIDADPTDDAVLDTIVFSIARLAADENDRSLYDLVLAHHVKSLKLRTIVSRSTAPDDFLRTVAEKSPHATVQAYATYHRAENLENAGKPADAEPLLESLKHNPEWVKQPGYVMGTLGDTADRLLFEIRNLSVGKIAPEIEGRDLDDKALKLSEFRGNVTLLVYWATWCGPCMAMVPHERELAEKLKNRPFAIVGINGDVLGEQQLPDGRKVDATAKVKATVEKEKITWRSFKNGQFDVGLRWNVRSWPTVYLLDPRGVITHKWRGAPESAELDAAIEKLLAAVESERDKK
jgi:thiol-disulfide isomerase/thioredoxin